MYLGASLGVSNVRLQLAYVVGRPQALRDSLAPGFVLTLGFRVCGASGGLQGELCSHV